MQGASTAVGVLSPVIGLAVNCGFHIVLARACGPAHPYRAIVRAGLIGLGVVIAINIGLSRQTTSSIADATASAFVNVATYAALSFDYFSFVNLCLTSLRIRMLQELHGAGGSLPLHTLHALHDEERLVGVRIQRLIDGGHLVQRDARLFGTGGFFVAIARLFDGLRGFILGDRPQLPSDRPGAP